MRPYTKKMVVKTFAKRDKSSKEGATVSYSAAHREWDVNEARDFVNHIDSQGGSKGLTYWSARDFLERHSKKP